MQKNQPHLKKNKNNMKYTALTIGPIVKSLGHAHKTREIWAASYFFSMLMEKIIEQLNKNKQIILPEPDKNNLITTLKIDRDKIKSAGIFPDRLILEGEHFNELQTSVNNAITELYSTFDFTCNKNELSKYISAHIVEFEYKARDLGKDKKGNKKEDNIIYQANDFLASCELQANYTAEDKECFIKMFDTFYETDFYKTKFGKNGFPSLLQISTKGINIGKENLNDDEIDDNTIWKKLKELNNGELKTNKKYIAIVQADGDNIGSIIKNVAKQGIKQIKDFSKALSSFSLLAAQEISIYGGTPVYTGGDDLLFFAPVTNGDDNIFLLFEKLDELFKDTIIDKFEFEKDKTPSMSYGLSISYYKFPMHEALKTARKLLFEKAKTGSKNNIGFKLQKHSGQIVEAVFHKPLNDTFKDLLNKNEGLVINSLLYGFEKHKTLLKESLKKNSKADLTAFFEHFYNEDIHSKSKDFIDKVKRLLETLYSKNNEDFDITLEQIKAQLRIIKFLNSSKDE